VQRGDGGGGDESGSGSFDELAAGDGFSALGLAHDHSNADTFW